MDFEGLTRRELQALCKENNIPANISNVAMVDALKALVLVEGIDDNQNSSDSDTAISSVESSQQSEITTQQKAAKNEPETLLNYTRTSKSRRRIFGGNADEVKNSVVETPVRQKQAATSAVKNVGSLIKECADEETQHVPKTPGALLTSHKKETKEKSSVVQVFSVRRSARLASKRAKEQVKQDGERSETIALGSFPEAVTEALEVNAKHLSLQFHDEIEKAVDKLPSKKIGGESNDDKDLKLDSSSDVESANFISANNGLSAFEESHGDECLNLLDPHVLPAAPISSLQIEQEVISSDMKQMDESNEPNATKISKHEPKSVGSEEPFDELTGHEDEAKAKGIACSGTLKKIQQKQAEKEPEAKDSDEELSSEDFTDDENQANYKGQYYTEDDDATEVISEGSDTELSYDAFSDDVNEPNIEGLPDLDEDFDTETVCSESSDNEQSLEEFTGENELNNEVHSYSKYEVASTDARQKKSPGGKELAGEFADDSAGTNISELSNKAEIKNIESSELLQGASETKIDANGAKKPVQEYSTGSATKESSGLKTVEAPSGLAETNSDNTIHVTCSTPMKKPSSKTPVKTPLSRMSGLKCVSDDKENIDSSGRKPVHMNKALMQKAGNAEGSKKDFPPTTKTNASTKETTRPALQQVVENRLVGVSGSNFEG